MENKDSGDSNLEHVTVITLGNLREQFELDEIRKDGEPIYIKKRDNKKDRGESMTSLKNTIKEIKL